MHTHTTPFPNHHNLFSPTKKVISTFSLCTFSQFLFFFLSLFFSPSPHHPTLFFSSPPPPSSLIHLTPPALSLSPFAHLLITLCANAMQCRLSVKKSQFTLHSFTFSHTHAQLTPTSTHLIRCMMLMRSQHLTVVVSPNRLVCCCSSLSSSTLSSSSHFNPQSPSSPHLCPYNIITTCGSHHTCRWEIVSHPQYIAVISFIIHDDTHHVMRGFRVWWQYQPKVWGSWSCMASYMMAYPIRFECYNPPWGALGKKKKKDPPPPCRRTFFWFVLNSPLKPYSHQISMFDPTKQFAQDIYTKHPHYTLVTIQKEISFMLKVTFLLFGDDLPEFCAFALWRLWAQRFDYVRCFDLHLYRVIWDIQLVRMSLLFTLHIQDV